MATAKKRQSIPVLPLEVARDAVREGRPAAEVVAATDSSAARLQLGLELVRAGMELLAAVGSWHTSTWAHDAEAGNARSIELVVRDSLTVDLIYLELAAFRDPALVATVIAGSPFTQKHFDGKTMRKASISVGGVRVDIRGPEVVGCARKVEGRQCTGENGHDGEHTFEEKT